MEGNKNCEDIGYKLIEELMEFASQRKTAEEVMHFVNIAFEYSFGATAIMFLHKKYDVDESVKISRGFSNFFIKKINENPPYKIIENLSRLKGGLFIDFKKERKNTMNTKSYSNMKMLLNFMRMNLKHLIRTRIL
jgi:hypothetical protein